jgi:hypothetical protein
VEPVNDTFRSRGSPISRVETRLAEELGMTFRTPGGKSRVGEDRGEEQAGERGQRGGFEHHGAAGRDRRRHLAGRHREREVPRGDQQAGADRCGRGQDAAAAGRGGEVAAADPRRLLAEPAQEVRAVVDLGAGFGQRLAHLGRDHQGEGLPLRDDGVITAAQDVGPGPGGRGRPARAGPDRGLQRRGDLRLARVGHLGERFAGGGILDRNDPAVLGRRPLAVDEKVVTNVRSEFDAHGRLQVKGV